MAYRHLERHLSWLSNTGNAHLIRHGLIGLEKECLRVDESGRLSRRPHPRALGAALTHRYITTDYAEALLEFVTPAHPDSTATMRCLRDIHQFAHARIEDELLWAVSMPCLLGDPDDIPIACYGESNLGRMKTIYRRGLSHRYRPAMQAIAGVHFNYSVPTTFWPAFQEAENDRTSPQNFVSERYMGLIRNFRRYGWLVLYLYGASPSLCKSFLPEGHPRLQEMDESSWYAPYGTSLRMSDLGYQNQSQAHLKISANSLPEYIADLTRAISTPNPDYARIGVRVNGHYRQLNTHLLQIENEYYSPIRPKRRIRSGERPTKALERAGIEYIELRSLDVAADNPNGVSVNQLRFLEAFLIFCLLEDSPPIHAPEQEEIDRRDVIVAREGRRPGLRIPCAGGEVTVAEWGAQVLDAMVAVCETLDDDDANYRRALTTERHKIDDPDRTPSARMLEEIARRRISFFAYGLDLAREHREYFRSLPDLPEETMQDFDRAVSASLAEAEALAQRDEPSFEDYLARYFQGVVPP